ncbi:MAG: DUF58 domain-containing protein [Cyclobacteriaceae bacterium]|nr:DUF58 domain-containing protein [Cyclobacteriaceae bacterium]
MKELLKKLRRYEIRIRKAINSQMQGDFHSIFKGTGLEFDDVRQYQYGDDVRTIDWNVSAKGHGTFVKTFKEEKEQTIFFLLDVSGSQQIGDKQKQKLDVAKEICGVLCLASAKESSQNGLLCFSDRKESYLRPSKGKKHAYEIINTIATIKPESNKTDLNKAILLTLNILKRRSVIIIISDFIDEDYFHNLKGMARKHDVVMIRVTDKRETHLPGLGIVPVKDLESGKNMWINTSFGDFKEKITGFSETNYENILKFSNRNQINFVSIDTKDDFVPKLIKLFKVRNKSLKSV